MENWQYIDKKLHWLLGETKKHITHRDYLNIFEFLDIGEQGLTLETLCNLINECQITLSPYALEIIEDMGKKMDINKRYWKNLKVNEQQRKIKINQPGKILSGKNAGWYIYVQPLGVDESNTDYLILAISSLDEPSPSGFYDIWIENFEELEFYFKESKWTIEWLDKKYTSRFIREGTDE